MSALRWAPLFALGVVLIGMGAFVAVRPLWTHAATLTGQRWLDVAFAVVFIFRGLVNIRTARARRRALAQL